MQISFCVPMCWELGSSLRPIIEWYYDVDMICSSKMHEFDAWSQCSGPKNSNKESVGKWLGHDRTNLREVKNLSYINGWDSRMGLVSVEASFYETDPPPVCALLHSCLLRNVLASPSASLPCHNATKCFQYKSHRCYCCAPGLLGLKNHEPK